MRSVLEISVRAVLPLREALSVMDKGGEGFLVVTEADGSVVGVVSDGDVRRALIHGVSLEVPVASVMNRDFKFWPQGSPRDAAAKYLKTLKCRQLPILDSARKLIDILFSDHLDEMRRDNPAVIMAGGRGVRLRPITESVPKPMLKIGDKPFLQNTLEILIDQGFRTFYFCVNYLAEQIVEHFGDGSRWGVNIRYVHEDKELGTAGALALIEDAGVRPCLVMNGDLVTKLDFGSLLDFHEAHGNAATMAVRTMEFQVPFGVVETSGSKVVEIKEKPVSTHLVNAGIYVVNPSCFRKIPKGEAIDMPSFLATLIRTNQLVGYFPIYESWLDIGRLEDYQRALKEHLTWDEEH